MKVEQLQSAVSHSVMLQAVLRAEATGLPYLIVSPVEEGRRVIVLEAADQALWIGQCANSGSLRHCSLHRAGEQALHEVALE